MAIQYITCVWRAHCTDISVQYPPSLTNSPRKIWGCQRLGYGHTALQKKSRIRTKSVSSARVLSTERKRIGHRLNAIAVHLHYKTTAKIMQTTFFAPKAPQSHHLKHSKKALLK